MRSFRMLDKLFMSFLTPQDQYDVLVDPGPDKTIEYDGKEIFLVNSKGRHMSITQNHAIEVWLSQGKIEEIFDK